MARFSHTVEIPRPPAEVFPWLLDAFLQVDLTTYALLRVTVSRRPDCPDCAGA